MTDEPNVHHNTRKAADMSLAKREISRDSHRAVHEGRLTLAEARSLGRNAGPSGPAVRADKDDRSRPCIACGGLTKGGRFHPGCDAKMFRVAREHLTEGRELTGEQTEYLEESGKMGRVRVKLAEEEKARERAARKAGK